MGDCKHQSNMIPKHPLTSGRHHLAPNVKEDMNDDQFESFKTMLSLEMTDREMLNAELEECRRNLEIIGYRQRVSMRLFHLDDETTNVPGFRGIPPGRTLCQKLDGTIPIDPLQQWPLRSRGPSVKTGIPPALGIILYIAQATGIGITQHDQMRYKDCAKLEMSTKLVREHCIAAILESWPRSLESIAFQLQQELRPLDFVDQSQHAQIIQRCYEGLPTFSFTGTRETVCHSCSTEYTDAKDEIPQRFCMIIVDTSCISKNSPNFEDQLFKNVSQAFTQKSSQRCTQECEGLKVTCTLTIDRPSPFLYIILDTPVRVGMVRGSALFTNKRHEFRQVIYEERKHGPSQPRLACSHYHLYIVQYRSKDGQEFVRIHNSDEIASRMNEYNPEVADGSVKEVKSWFANIQEDCTITSMVFCLRRWFFCKELK